MTSLEGAIFSPFGKLPLLPPLEKGAGGFNEGGARTMQNKSSIDEKAKSHPTSLFQREELVLIFKWKQGRVDELIKLNYTSSLRPMRNQAAFDFLGSQISAFSVIPAIGACPVLDTGAGIQFFQGLIDSRLRGNDVSATFYEFVKLNCYRKPALHSREMRDAFDDLYIAPSHP